MDDTARGIGDASEVDADVERRTSEIRRDIEQTRDDMSETIEAIEEKLRPGNIVSSATERVKNAATERVRNMKQSAEHAYSRMRSGAEANSGGLIGEIRQNPIPAAMIGVGAAWLLMRRRSKSIDDRSSQFDEYSSRARSGSYDMTEPEAFGAYRDTEVGYRQGDDTGVARNRPYRDSGYGGGWIEQIEHNPVPAAMTAVGLGWLLAASRNRQEAASGSGQSAGHLAARAQDYTRDVADEARDRGRRMQSQLQRMARENPLMVGAGALLLGSVVGLAIPETRQENEWLGETRDSMLDKAQEMARTTAARAQEAAADLAGEAASRIVGAPSE